MAYASPPIASPHHHSRRMVGRDPHEPHRTATPLELLFDLTFAASFGVAASQLAHALAADHIGAGLIGFGVASFAICWAWTNFSWFASAFDTDDWPFRAVTLLQMAGVLLLAIGMPRMFASVVGGQHLDSGVMVAGYVVMRIAMVCHWLRAARQDPPRRAAALTYAGFVTAAQIGWVALIAARLPLAPTLAILCLLALVEFAAPVIAERMAATPWHAHHMAERYSLFAIIALGEGIVGAVAALSAVVDAQGWTPDTALVCLAGVGMPFGIWWVYYALPSGEVLHVHRERAFVWSYGQLGMIIAIVGMGGGLQTAAAFIDHRALIGPLATILAVAVPVSVFLGAIYGLYAYLVRRFDPLHAGLLIATAVIVAGSVWAAAAGVAMADCLAILTLAPIVTVVGYEARGYRHRAQALAEEAAAPQDP